MEQLWGIVLAGAGVERTRWRLPFSLRHPLGPRSPRESIERLTTLIPATRLVAVLTGAHADAIDGLADVRRVIQPVYRGSAVELFLALLVIRRLDPQAIVAAMPMHEIARGGTHLLSAVRAAAAATTVRPDLPLVVGDASPARSPLGVIEPGAAVAGLESFGVRAVRRFGRHPDARAHDGAEDLRNTGIVVASARTLLGIGRRRVADVLESLEPLEAVFGGPEERLLRDAVYEAMPYADVAHALFTADEPFGVLAASRVRSRLRWAASA